MNGRPLDEPIPKIQFDNFPHSEVQRNLKDCLQYAWSAGIGSHGWMLFVDWLLWGLNSSLVPEFPSRICEELSWKWYTTFNMGLMLKYPADHMAWASCELASPKAWQGNGYFPTPMNICVMMANITHGLDRPEKDLRGVVNDPCLGTGSMLLAASNHSLRLTGQDVSLDMVKMATVNSYLFMPWLACPPPEGFDWQTDEEKREILGHALEAFETWQTEKAWLRLEYSQKAPKTGSLTDWF